MSLFDQSNAPDLSDVTPEQALEELVGEGKKYPSVAEMAKAMLHSQQHIGKLESENGEYRAKLERASTIDEILGKLNGQQQQSQQQQQSSIDQGTTPDVNKLVEEALAKSIEQRNRQSNLDAFKDALVRQFGDGAANKYASVKGELGGVDIDEIAAKNPAAALKFFGSGNTTVPGSTAHDLSRNVLNEQAKPGTDLYFYKMRQANPKMPRDEYYRLRREALLADPQLFHSQRAPKS